MKKFYGYIRVSTERQGTHSVSLPEQKTAIEQFALRHGFSLVRWFEERKTAAKRGRPVYNEMVSLLKRGRAEGVIVHKIDRSARNLRDWAELGELIDAGIDVRFASDDLDLRSRGGRLAADIQAVVAADYIRNLREEAKKGLYGRLKQGIWPFAAPVGYLDRGGGKPKEVDPLMAPLVQEAFMLYSGGSTNIESLRVSMFERGLMNRRGRAFSKNAMAEILRNPFYIGILHVKISNQSFAGAHTPIIVKNLFDKVRDVLDGKGQVYVKKHAYRFRRLLTCGACGKSLTGECQRGLVYYRCHRRECQACLREETVERRVQKTLFSIRFRPEELVYIRERLETEKAKILKNSEGERRSLELRISDAKEKILRLVDLLAEGTLERELFEEKKRRILEDQRGSEERLEQLRHNPLHRLTGLWEKFEQGGTALLSYQMGNDDKKRDIVSEVSSNRSVTRKDVVVELDFPYSVISNQSKNIGSGPDQAGCRSRESVPDLQDGCSQDSMAPRSPEVLDKIVSEVLSKLSPDCQNSDGVAEAEGLDRP